MPARQGGSYTADPNTGKETLVERTEIPDFVTVEPTEPAPDVPTGPAVPALPEAGAAPLSARRRGGAGQPQE